MSESRDCFKFQSTIFTSMARNFLNLVLVVKNWWIFVLLFYCLCIKDFIDIYIYSVLKITKRTLWMLQAVGLFQTINHDSFSSNKIVQTDMIRKKDVQISPFENRRNRKLNPSLQTSPQCKLKLSFSPPKIKIKDDEMKTADCMSHKLSSKKLETSPAILKLEADIPKQEAYPSATHSQTPLCNINLSLTPSVETGINEKYSLSPEERNFLKRRWRSWKLRQYIRKMKRNQEDSERQFACPENETFSEWSPNGTNEKICEEPVTPEGHGCCSSLVTKFKSKLNRERNCPSVSYKHF